MTAPPAWTSKISSYLEGLNITEEISDEDFDFDFDDDYEPEFADEWDVMDDYVPDIPLPTE